MIILTTTLFSLVGTFLYTNNKSTKYMLLFFTNMAILYQYLSIYSPYSYSLWMSQADLLSMSLIFISSMLLLLSPLTQRFSCSSMSSLYMTLVLLMAFCFYMFTTTNLLILFISYEGSLLPIIYIILKWGVYPERGLSAMMMLLFTSFFTFPLILFLLTSSLFTFTLFPYTIMPSLSMGASIWVMFSFAVKLPIFGLHYWLPMAHVEAPTFGSMILAGILLKLGGCGLLRLIPLFNCHLQQLSKFFSIFTAVGVILSAILCCMQSDFKRLVAYSSVSHMTFIFLLIMLPSPISSLSLVMLMIFHGISSPLLFFGVGQVNNILTSREMIMFRGITTLTPFLMLTLLLSFLMSIPTPPFLPFLCEILVFYSVMPLSILMPTFMFIMLLLGLLYNLLWFLSMQGKSTQLVQPQPLTSLFIPTSLSILSFSALPIILL